MEYELWLSWCSQFSSLFRVKLDADKSRFRCEPWRHVTWVTTWPRDIITWHERFASIFHVAGRLGLSFNFDTELYRAGPDLLTRRHWRTVSQVSHPSISQSRHQCYCHCQILFVRLSVCLPVRLSVPAFTVSVSQPYLWLPAAANVKSSITLASVMY